MKPEEYVNMITNMIEATDMRNLRWEKTSVSGDSEFTTKIGNCKIVLSNYYDEVIDDVCYSLALHNEDGENYRTLRYSPSDSKSIYSSLIDLYNSVLDSYYKIRESEKKILDELEQLILPF